MYINVYSVFEIVSRVLEDTNVGIAIVCLYYFELQIFVIVIYTCVFSCIRLRQQFTQ